MGRDGAHKTIDCGCVAGQFGTPCYHAAAALGVHMGLVRVKTAAAQVAAAVKAPAITRRVVRERGWARTVGRVGPYVI
jgi:hypothetical protein